MTQDEALDLLKLGNNVFLTGAAGSGKTWLLNQYINYLQGYNVDIAVTASTGIAATHLQGRTIHSWSGIGVLNELTDRELEKLLRNSRIKRNYKNTKVLIIDEISMLHGYQLNMIERIARHMLDANKPFGGMQIIICGDFFQLPPVSSNSISTTKQFAYESSAWQTGDFHICYLHEQHRQGNDPLLSVLNDIRSGTAGEHTKVPLRTRYKREPEGDVQPTKLYSRNINVDVINDKELAKINAKEKVFLMESRGFDTLVEGLKKSCLAPERLRLKVGTEVMFIKNATSGAYVNGTRGVVTGFDKEQGWPLVKTFDNDLITANPEDWQYEENGVVRATITQVPLRLAWAITIHKSQGMTIDAAEIDLGDAFEPGMGYVALSRVRRLNGLKLMALNEVALQVDPKILAQDKLFKDASHSASQYVQTFSTEEKKRRHREILIDRFKGKLSGAKKHERVKKHKKAKKTPTHIITLEMLKGKNTIEAIAKKRNLKIGTLLDHLEKLKGSKQLPDIDYIKNTLPKQVFETIFDELQKSRDGKLKPIYEKFDKKYSYNDLKVVRLFVR